MAVPNLYGDIAIAANKKKGKKHCHVYLGCENLDEATMRVDVERTDHLRIDVQQASVVLGRTTPQVLILRTKEVPKRPHWGDTEEITVTVTDTGGSAQTEVDVVYYEELPDPPDPPPPAAARKTTASKAKKKKPKQKKAAPKLKK